MKKIASFEVDHTRLLPGMYVSRVDGDITTYDLRFRRPNTEPPMDIDSMHTIEHLAATWMRNSDRKEDIIYFGPMGCRTGFYFLTRNVEEADVLSLVKETLRFIADFEGDIPGVSAIECGNWKEHDLVGAKRYAKEMSEKIAQKTVADMRYTKG